MKNWEPTIKQERFVEALLEGKLIKEAAKHANICRDTYYKTWRKSPDFLAYLEQRRRQVASARTPRVDNELFKKIEEGDIGAMRLFYEVFGHLRTGQIVINSNQTQEPEGEKSSEIIRTKLDELAARRKARAER